MSLDELKQRALGLGPRERADLAAALLESLDLDSESLWLEEAERRLRAYREGRVRAREASVVLSEARARLS